jgi:hypothetical protein
MTVWKAFFLFAKDTVTESIYLNVLELFAYPEIKYNESENNYNCSSTGREPHTISVVRFNMP